MVIEFMGYDDNLEAKAPIRIELNGGVIYQGDSPFPNAAWGSYGLLVPDVSLIKQGTNVLTISNTATEGALAQPPFFLIQSVTVHYQ